MNILICGSRQWPQAARPAMQAEVERIVAFIAENNYRLIVGDAPGVDALAVQFAEQHRVVYMCYGLKPQARNGATHYGQLRGYSTWSMRDKYMVGMAGFVHCVWNGNSPGTKAVHEYAQALSIGTHLWSDR